jgi:hypothetical protein
MKMHRPKVVKGAGFFKWMRKSALPWIKKHKILSRGARTLSKLGVPYVVLAGRAAGFAGYGRPRKGRKIAYRRRKYGRAKKYKGGNLGGYP